MSTPRSCRSERMPDHINATIEAADRVACEFVHERRVQFIAQAITREHPQTSDVDARKWASRYART